jgi:hypothetical protein
MGRAISTHGEKRNVYRVWWQILKETDHYRDLGIGGRIIFKWILETQDGVLRSRLICLRIGINVGHL